MKVHSLSIEGPKLITMDTYHDDRGYFVETFRNSWASLLNTDNDVQFVQGNLSRSTKGVLRGLHYQIPPMPQGKIVKAIVGSIWDVVVDIRKSSNTFGKWVGVELSEEKAASLWVPPGFAHGFYVLSDIAYVNYLTTSYYSPEHERSLNWEDQKIGIDWPLNEAPLLSPKDAAAPMLIDAELYP